MKGSWVLRSARSELDRAAMSIVLVGASVKVGRTKMSLLELRQRFLEGCLDDWFVGHMFVAIVVSIWVEEAEMKKMRMKRE
jgi:hypothetical protein